MDTAFAVVTRRGYAVRRVAKVLEVSRSRLHERLSQGSKPRVRYQKAEDAELLESVRRLVDERPTYGYRRIGALLNRERAAAGLSRLNHKRMYRLMAQNGLLLQRYTGSHQVALTTARSSRSDPIYDGPRMASRSPVGTARSYVSPLRWIPVIGKSLPGVPASAASAAR